MVYIREAHAIDGMSPRGGGEMPIVEDPMSLEERRDIAATCMTKLALEPMSALVDDMDDTVNAAYDAWPDRLYLIGKDGRIVFRGEPGPRGFLPEALAQAIQEELARPDASEG